MKIIGHRGAMGDYPQNTLESFKAAIEAGFDMIECDVQLLPEGKVIVFHDQDLTLVTGNQDHSSVKNFTYENLKKINVHDNKGEDSKTYQIPLLKDVLNLVIKRHIKINIELKGIGTALPTARIIEKYLKKGCQINDFIVSSFLHDELAKFKRTSSKINIALLVDSNQWEKEFIYDDRLIVKKAISMKAVAINPSIKFVNKNMVNKAHKAGLGVNVWTVDTPKELNRMHQMGVDGVFVNYLTLANPKR